MSLLSTSLLYLLLLAIPLTGGCGGDGRAAAIAKLREELGVRVDVRTSRIGPDTYSVAFFQTEGIDEAFSLIEQHCRPLTGLTCRDLRLTDTQFETVARLEELGRLDLYGVPLTNAVEPLASLSQLKSLNLAGADGGDEQLEMLRPALANLKSLAVGPRTSDDGLAALADSTELSMLFLGDSQVTGEGLRHVPPNSLRSLWLDRSAFDESQAEVLLRFPRLERLGLGGLPVSKRTLEVVRRLEAIDYLSLENTAIGDECIEVLAAMPKLYVLDTPGSNFTPEGLQRLKQLQPRLLIGAEREVDLQGAEDESATDESRNNHR